MRVSFNNVEVLIVCGIERISNMVFRYHHTRTLLPHEMGFHNSEKARLVMTKTT